MTINWEHFRNPYFLVFLVIPLLTVVISIFITKFSGKVWVSPTITFICATSSVIFVFGPTFIVWAVIYLVLSTISSFFAYKILR